MKAIYLLMVSLIMMSLASCTAEGNDPVENTFSTHLLIDTYGARSVLSEENNSNKLNLADLPAMSVAEANAMLTKIRKHDQAQKTSKVNASDITMNEMISNKYTFTIQLNVTKGSNGTPMYNGYKATSSSDLFRWYFKGFSFACDIQKGNYKFESQTYLYIKVIDKGVQYMQVPLNIRGTYNPDTHSADFTYSL